MIKLCHRQKMRLFLLISVIAFSGCAPETAVRGNFLKDYQLERVEPGKDTRQSVLRAFGSPTARDPFDENIWFYLGQQTEKHGILDPEIKDQLAVRVIFDDNGIVKSLDKMEGGHTPVPIAREETPTGGGTEQGPVQQFLKNIGRFNRPVPDLN